MLCSRLHLGVYSGLYGVRTVRLCFVFALIAPVRCFLFVIYFGIRTSHDRPVIQSVS